MMPCQRGECDFVPFDDGLRGAELFADKIVFLLMGIQVKKPK